MNEWLIITVVLWSTGLFAAGGTDIPGIGGKKWLRRFVLPAGVAALALLYAPWWACAGYGATMCAFLHLGYGSKASWPYRAFIFAGYGLGSLWLGWSWWSIITPALCCLLFLLSNNRWTERLFPWKFVELSYGFLLGITYCAAIAK